MLGLSWTRDEVARITDDKKEGENASYPSKLIYPLSLMIKPDLLDILRANFGLDTKSKDGMPHIPGNTTSLSNTSKEDFISKMGMGNQFSMSSDSFVKDVQNVKTKTDIFKQTPFKR